MLPGNENAVESLIWSPDGRSIAFVADRKLKAIDLVGGTIRTISDDVGGAIGGGFWNSDGTIVFSAFRRRVIRPRSTTSLVRDALPRSGSAAQLRPSPGRRPHRRCGRDCEPTDAVKRDKLVFVFDFFDELRRLAPTSAR